MSLTLNTSRMYLLTAAALLPAIYLMIYVYRLDRVEKEPIVLLLKLILGGVIATQISLVAELAADEISKFTALIFNSNNFYPIMLAVCVGIIEESSKMLMLKTITWKNSAFDYRFDGIVYAVFVSLGFAAFENLLYVMKTGIGVAIGRGLLSIPAHTAFGVLMGIYYGRAKVCAIRNDASDSSVNLKRALIHASILHAIYDGAILAGTNASMMIFTAVVVVLYALVFGRIKQEALSDERIL